jgi:hypothetical protein
MLNNDGILAFIYFDKLILKITTKVELKKLFGINGFIWAKKLYFYLIFIALITKILKQP